MPEKKHTSLLWASRIVLALALLYQLYLFIPKIGYDEPGATALNVLGLACLVLCLVAAVVRNPGDWRLAAVAAGLTLYLFSIYNSSFLIVILDNLNLVIYDSANLLYTFILLASLILGLIASILLLLGADRRRMSGAVGIFCFLAGIAFVAAVAMSPYYYMPGGIFRPYLYPLFPLLYIGLGLFAVYCARTPLLGRPEASADGDQTAALLEERGILLAILLSFLSFGIYYIVWVHGICKRIRLMAGESPACGGEVALFFLVPFYQWYWMLTRGKKLAQAGARCGVPLLDRSVIALVLAVVGLGTISIALFQWDLNSAAVAFRSAGAGAQTQPQAQT